MIFLFQMILPIFFIGKFQYLLKGASISVFLIFVLSFVFHMGKSHNPVVSFKAIFQMKNLI